MNRLIPISILSSAAFFVGCGGDNDSAFKQAGDADDAPITSPAPPATPEKPELNTPERFDISNYQAESIDLESLDGLWLAITKERVENEVAYSRHLFYIDETDSQFISQECQNNAVVSANLDNSTVAINIDGENFTLVLLTDESGTDTLSGSFDSSEAYAIRIDQGSIGTVTQDRLTAQVNCFTEAASYTLDELASDNPAASRHDLNFEAEGFDKLNLDDQIESSLVAVSYVNDSYEQDTIAIVSFATGWPTFDGSVDTLWANARARSGGTGYKIAAKDEVDGSIVNSFSNWQTQDTASLTYVITPDNISIARDLNGDRAIDDVSNQNNLIDEAQLFIKHDARPSKSNSIAEIDMQVSSVKASAYIGDKKYIFINSDSPKTELGLGDIADINTRSLTFLRSFFSTSPDRIEVEMELEIGDINFNSKADEAYTSEFQIVDHTNVLTFDQSWNELIINASNLESLTANLSDNVNSNTSATVNISFPKK